MAISPTNGSNRSSTQAAKLSLPQISSYSETKLEKATPTELRVWFRRNARQQKDLFQFQNALPEVLERQKQPIVQAGIAEFRKTADSTCRMYGYEIPDEAIESLFSSKPAFERVWAGSPEVAAPYLPCLNEFKKIRARLMPQIWQLEHQYRQGIDTGIQRCAQNARQLTRQLEDTRRPFVQLPSQDMETPHYSDRQLENATPRQLQEWHRGNASQHEKLSHLKTRLAEDLERKKQRLVEDGVQQYRSAMDETSYKDQVRTEIPDKAIESALSPKEFVDHYLEHDPIKVAAWLPHLDTFKAIRVQVISQLRQLEQPYQEAHAVVQQQIDRCADNVLKLDGRLQRLQPAMADAERGLGQRVASVLPKLFK